jgi:hypothetical protein
MTFISKIISNLLFFETINPKQAKIKGKGKPALESTTSK